MSWLVFHKLLAIFFTVALGWLAGRRRWLGADGDPARVLGQCAFFLFVPALLFRTTVRLDFSTMPWSAVAAFFVPVMALLLLAYLQQRRTRSADRHGPAAPAVRAIAVTFGNSVQVGIPLAAALFGEAGLRIHIALVSLHALVLLSAVTALAELDIARARARAEGAASAWDTLMQTVRSTVIHPVVLPVLAGLAWNATGIGLHPVADEALQVLGAAVVPICLVLIGLNLAQQGGMPALGGALRISLAKLVLLPALVLAVAALGFGLTGVTLAVVVMMAALPVGSNALIFGQRYETLVPETTTAIVLSTIAFGATAPLWLGLLAWLGRAA
ncbi:MAG: AEC family transporter [Aquabacterium sp.]